MGDEAGVFGVVADEALAEQEALLQVVAEHPLSSAGRESLSGEAEAIAHGRAQDRSLDGAEVG